LRHGITEATLKAANITPIDEFELNLEPEYWVKRFLFPYALDNSALRLEDFPLAADVKLSEADKPKIMSRQKNKESIDVLNTDKYNFPRSHIDRKKEYLIDIKHPLMIQKERLLEDMYSYSRKFPIKIIPHVTELGEINDIIHNYKQPKMK